MTRSKFSTCLWFDTEAEAAVTYYCSIFKTAKIGSVARYGKGAPMPEGTAMVVHFELDGQRYMALNGGPHFKLSEAVSIIVECEDQAEVDEYWEKLTAGGSPSRCGWLKDKFGLSWQIMPKEFLRLMGSGDKAASGRMFAAMMTMGKLDMPRLKAAYDGN